MTSKAIAIAFSFLLISPLALPNFNLASGKGKGSSNSANQTRTRVEADLDPVNNFVGEGSSKYEKKGAREQFEATVEIPVDVNDQVNGVDPNDDQVKLKLTLTDPDTLVLTDVFCKLDFDEIELDLQLGMVAEYKVVIQRNGGLPFAKKGSCSTSSDGLTPPLVLPVVHPNDTASVTLDGPQILTGTFQNH